MRHRALSLTLAGLAVLLMATTVFAQTTFVTTGRVDTIIGFSQARVPTEVAPGTFVPQVRAMDRLAAAQGEPIVSYVTDLETYFVDRFGWRPSAETTVLLYTNNETMIGDLQSLRGTPMTDLVSINGLSQPAILTKVNQSNGPVPEGSWAILVSLDMDAANRMFNEQAFQFSVINNQSSLIPGVNVPTTNTIDQAALDARNAMAMIQQSLARQYTQLMIEDLAGISGPEWFRSGLADSISFALVPGVPQEQGEALAVARYEELNNNIPTLSQIQDVWSFFIGQGGLTAETARGIGFLASRTLTNTLSGSQIASILENLGSGSSFDSQLQSTAGFDLAELDIQFQSLIPIP